MKGQKTVFLITDTQIKEEAFLEDIDSVLNTGEVPNIFAADEKQEVMEVRAFGGILCPAQEFSYHKHFALLFRTHITYIIKQLDKYSLYNLKHISLICHFSKVKI